MYLQGQVQCPEICSLPCFGKWVHEIERWKPEKCRKGDQIQTKEERLGLRDLITWGHLLQGLSSDTWHTHLCEEETLNVTCPSEYTQPWKLRAFSSPSFPTGSQVLGTGSTLNKFVELNRNSELLFKHKSNEHLSEMPSNEFLWAFNTSNW